MDCRDAQEALSARLDGELPVVSIELAQQHVVGCARCAAWADAAGGLHRSLRLHPAAEVPDLTPRILAAIGDLAPTRAVTEDLRPLQFLLAACAVLQVLLCLPAVLAQVGTSVHLDHELGAWDAALAVGLLIAALRPERAWGMLPLVAAIALLLLGTGVLDVASGHTTLSGESTHAVELLGLALLWALASRRRAALLAS